MKNTAIQWCHSTINPVMGCDGCELWPGPDKITTQLASAIVKILAGTSTLAEIRKVVARIVNDRTTADMYRGRKAIAGKLAKRFGLDKTAYGVLVDVIRSACKCYAGHLGTNRAGHKGYADKFIEPKPFPGRMANAAQWKQPSAVERADNPWLLDAPRMIFVSDMGDALSRIVSFEYLKQEVIDAVTSAEGRRHLWLWLTKRPKRMAELGAWLAAQGISWPDNLVAMTTVTSPETAGRINELRKVPSKFKGLSCEPVFAELHLDLTEIDWVIIGGGSDALAEPFQVEWALSLREQCRQAGVAFFLKQMGKNATFNGRALKLANPHGGEWDEWPDADWRTREIPEAFRGDNWTRFQSMKTAAAMAT